MKNKLVVNRYGKIKDVLVEETSTFILADEISGIEKTDERLIKIDGYEGLWFWLETTNPLFDLDKHASYQIRINEGNQLTKEDKEALHPYAMPLGKDVEIITKEQYTSLKTK